MSDTSPLSPRPATIASVVAFLLVMSPIVQNHLEEPVDDFPLSYFPMFTKVRNGETTLVHAIALLPEGGDLDLHYKYAGRGGMNLVRRQMRKQVRQGKADSLCNSIAKRVRRDMGDELPEKLVGVAVVRDRYVFEDFFGDGPRVADREVLAMVPLNGERTP